MMAHLRKFVLFVAITLALLLAFLGVAELAARALGPPEPDLGSDLHWMANFADGDVTLDDPPWFTVDENGFQVANWLTPGTNELGYRTPSFDEPANGRPTILFLGDSFTWGVDARPVNLCYADRVRDMGYKVINLGIPATGPVQYEAQAQRYLPELKPDAVCVMYYAGNDWMPEAPIHPVPARWYETNAGMLYALMPDGDPLTFEQAVRRRTELCPFWLTPGVARSLSGLALVRFAAAWSDDARFQPAAGRPDVACVERIRDLAGANGVKFFLFIIPMRPGHERPITSVAFAQKSLASCGPRVLPGLVDADYAPLPDLHFNNIGHGKMSDFIAVALQESGIKPKPESHSPDSYRDLLGNQPTFDEFSLALGLDPQQSAAARMAISRMRHRTKTLFARTPVEGGQSPVAYFQAQHKEDSALARQRTLDYLRTVTVPGMGMPFDGAAEQYAIAAYREVGALLTRDQQILLKRIPLERFSEIDTGTEPPLSP